MLLIRTPLLDDIPDGMSCVFKKIVTLFFNDASHNLATSGMSVMLYPGESHIIFADVDVVIADAEAFHSMYGCKGTSGLKPCLCCLNVYNRRTARDVIGRGRLMSHVYHTCSDPDKFRPTTPAVLAAFVARLRTAPASELAELETRLGWKFMPNGVMFCPSVRARVCPCTTVMYDWAHVIFVNGVFNIHAGLLLHAIRGYGTPIDSFVKYVRSFKWPCAVSSRIDPADVVSTNRLKISLAAQTLKATEGVSKKLQLILNCNRIAHAHTYTHI